MKRLGLLFLFLILIPMLSGCSLLEGSTPEISPTNTPIIMPTEIELPTAAQIMTPTPTVTPEPAPTIEPVKMLEAQVIFDSYILRTGPGRLFDRVSMYDTGVEVTLFGREVSNNWVLVFTADHQAGWMNVVGLEILGDINSLPVFSVDNAQVLHGHVYNQGGDPATGITVSIASSDTDLSASTDVSTTYKDGVWAIYMPADQSGEWIIGPNSYSCEDSNAVIPTEDSCVIDGKFPAAQTIELPLENNLGIEFQILPAGGSD